MVGRESSMPLASGAGPGTSGSSADSRSFSARILQENRYLVKVEFSNPKLPPFRADEPPPLGGGQGPSPAETLAAAIGECMTSTFYNALERARVPVTPIETVVTGTVGQNPQGRLRVVGLKVQIRCSPVDPQDQARFDHCRAIFEDFCTVSAAVKDGIPISTEVGPSPGPGAPGASG